MRLVFVIAFIILAGSARSAEIKVFSLPGISNALKDLAPKFEAATGHKLTIIYEVNGPMMRRLESAEPFDAIIANDGELTELENQGKVDRNTRAQIGRVGIVVWTRPESPHPDISNVDKFKSFLLSAESISYTKESGAGRYLANMIEKLGVADQVNPKTKLLGGGGQNPKAVAAGDVQYSMSVKSDGLGVPNVEPLGPLPDGLQTWFVFIGAIATDSPSKEAAKAFLSYLQAPEATNILSVKGFER